MTWIFKGGTLIVRQQSIFKRKLIFKNIVTEGSTFRAYFSNIIQSLFFCQDLKSQSHILPFSGSMITNLERKNLFSEELKVHVSILPKFLTLPFALEITYIRLFKLQKLDFEHKMMLELSIKLR